MVTKEEIELYRGKPYVCQVRASDDGEKQNSDEAQLLYLKNWANERLMVHVHDFVEPDLSGSLPGNRTDLQDLLDRADTLGDFVYVLARHCMSSLTNETGCRRSGVGPN